ncbi:transposase domain-containing protein [Phaeovulum sp. W22_SRMD_FR3]
MVCHGQLLVLGDQQTPDHSFRHCRIFGEELTLIETCKLNGVDPHVWLAATLVATVKGNKQSQIGDLLSWTCAANLWSGRCLRRWDGPIPKGGPPQWEHSIPTHRTVGTDAGHWR